MIILDYSKKQHNQIIQASVKALKQGKIIAYPTDTCYGLAVDVSNVSAVKKLYRLKGRNFNKPSSVVVPSVMYAKKIVKWGSGALKLAKKFWPGAITLVLGIMYNGFRREGFRILSANSGYLGIRMPNNKLALDLAKHLNKPITATSANLSGLKECYSAKDIIKQFQNQKLKPDMVIDVGKLPLKKPSTLVKITPSGLPPFGKLRTGFRKREERQKFPLFSKEGEGGVQILRVGPITKKQINQVLGVGF